MAWAGNLLARREQNSTQSRASGRTIKEREGRGKGEAKRSEWWRLRRGGSLVGRTELVPCSRRRLGERALALGRRGALRKEMPAELGCGCLTGVSRLQRRLGGELLVPGVGVVARLLRFSSPREAKPLVSSVKGLFRYGRAKRC